MLRRLQSVTEQRLPNAGGRDTTVTGHGDESSNRFRYQLDQSFVVGECICRGPVLEVGLKFLELLDGSDDFRDSLRFGSESAFFPELGPLGLGINQESKYWFASALGGFHFEPRDRALTVAAQLLGRDIAVAMGDDADHNVRFGRHLHAFAG